MNQMLFGDNLAVTSTNGAITQTAFEVADKR